MGRAYGFFDCKASKGEVEAELPTLRDAAQTPSGLELSLIEGVDRLRGDPDLMRLAQEAKRQGNRLVLEAEYPNATNSKAADELKDILVQAYQSPLFKPEASEPFRGGIVYRENGKYVFKN